MHDTSTTIETTDADTARGVVAAALTAFAADRTTSVADATLALAMSENVRGWTHTTRLRDFLEGVAR